VDEDLSPELIRKTTHLATKLSSFASAADSVNELFDLNLKPKRVERLSERIGAERVTERDAAVEHWKSLSLVERLSAPPGVKAPTTVCAGSDGGRMQCLDVPEDAKSHWVEMKVGVLLELETEAQTDDPSPQIPDKFLDLAKMEEVTREIKHRVPKGSPFAHQESPSPEGQCLDPVAAAREPVVMTPLKVVSRDVTASLGDAHSFGQQLAAHAWALGFAGAQRKAYLGDGSSTNWGIWEREFKHQNYTPILDFIHALTYIFSAAMAGRTRAEGASDYLSWITNVWQGKVVHVIKDLATRMADLGPPPPDCPENDPRQVIATTLTYLTNQQSRMNYPDYRKAGLPITSSHVESTVKQINQRVKGTEKFWTEFGGEAMLQLRADQLSDTHPLDVFWTRRIKSATGTRKYRRNLNAAA
jgi:hypothetical protein